jgi:hypothetical protein
MGDFLLGALLGRNQSFEDFTAHPQGWTVETGQAAFSQVQSHTAVHSSPAGLAALVSSTGGGVNVLRYDHGAADDAHRVWFPEVTAHALRSTVWARMTDAPGSGALCWRLDVGSSVLSVPFAHAAGLLPYTVSAQVTSVAGVPGAGLARTTPTLAAATAYLDDVLTVVDGIVLQPGWGLEERERVQRTFQRTEAAGLRTYDWHRHEAFHLPLAWLTPREAALLNWWWESQCELAFTLDSSDAESVRLCRIVNARQPIGQRMRPYTERWTGNLELAALHDGRLSF